MSQFLVASDGGGNSAVQGACASILQQPHGRREKVVLHLGPADGAEAELMAAILSAALLEVALAGSTAEEGILWLTDSAYLIRSAAELAALGFERLPGNFGNAGLWNAWVSIPCVRQLRPTHVRAHSGHRLNEACDRACRWVQRSGPRLLRENGEGPVGLSAKRRSGESWQLFEGATLLGALRSGALEPALDSLFDICRRAVGEGSGRELSAASV